MHVSHLLINLVILALQAVLVTLVIRGKKGFGVPPVISDSSERGVWEVLLYVNLVEKFVLCLLVYMCEYLRISFCFCLLLFLRVPVASQVEEGLKERKEVLWCYAERVKPIIYRLLLDTLNILRLTQNGITTKDIFL